VFVEGSCANIVVVGASACEHLLDRLPGDPEFSRDLGL
jgi:hypothetical protein